MAMRGTVDYPWVVYDLRRNPNGEDQNAHSIALYATRDEALAHDGLGYVWLHETVNGQSKQTYIAPTHLLMKRWTKQ